MHNDFLTDIVSLQNDFLKSKPIETRKNLGQFFTGMDVSDYMASLIEEPESNTIRILDAGAGTGTLTVSTAIRCLELGIKTVYAVLYELDMEALPSLIKTLNIARDIFIQHGANFTYDIRFEDFVLSRPDKNKSIQPFDISVINPPYFKYNVKESPYAKAVADLYAGDPNIYASFLSIVMACMKDGGQLVSITPRSFTNGLYFKGFRNYLLKESALHLIHIFKSRDKLFRNGNSRVLQENIICRFVKGSNVDTVTVRSSDSIDNVNRANEEQYPLKLIIDYSNEQRIIRIPESAYEAKLLKLAEIFKTTFKNAGYFISTGRVVEHRARQYITQETTAPNSVPLYRPHNIKPLTAVWSGGHKKDVSFMLNDGHEKHMMENGIFVLLKRVTSKDEKRRLIAAVHLDSAHDCKLIGFGNKINYIGLYNGKLATNEAYGLAAVFNSSFMDKYFRCISGNTQVNATEIRVMRFPSRDQVKEIGKQTQKHNEADTSKIDSIVNQVLGITDFI